MRAFSYVWSLPVTWQRWRSHYWSSHIGKSHATCKLHDSILYRIGVIADQSFTLGEYGFSTSFFAPLTLNFTGWPSCTNMIHTPSKYTGRAKNEFIKSRLSKVIVLQTNRHIYIYATKIIYHPASRMNKKFKRQCFENKFQIRTVLNLERVLQNP